MDMKRWMLFLLAAALLVLPVGAYASQPSGWAAEGVQAATAAGLVPESLQTNYDAPITRAEFCALASALYTVWEEAGQVRQKTPQPVSFTDCEDEAVLRCASMGIVNGIGGGRFDPDAPIRRQEAASMLHRLALLRTDADTSPAMPHVFSDGADLRAWSRSDVYWAYENGIMLGTGDNGFSPNGSYTREQSILTMLRLYDPTQAASPSEAPEYPYHEVVDSAGVGVLRVHLEDADGNHVLTDIGDSGGYFYTTEFFGSWISVTWDGGSKMALYVPDTGRLMEGSMLDTVYKSDTASGVAWGWEANVTRDRVVLHADGTTGGTYLPLTGWYNGQAIVWLDDNTLGGINAAEKVLWSCPAPGTPETMVTNCVNDRIAIQQDGGWKILDSNGTLSPLIPGGLRLCRWSDSYIVDLDGTYTLYDGSGAVLAGPYAGGRYAESLREVGQDLYCYSNDGETTYFRCPAGSRPTPLFSGVTVEDSSVATDGGGVYAILTAEHTILCFDRFGDLLSTIQLSAESAAQNCNVTFADGCLEVSYSLPDGQSQVVRYLPTGELVS